MKTNIAIAVLQVLLGLAMVTTCLGQQSSSTQAGAQNKPVSVGEDPSAKIVRADGSTITGTHYWNPYFGFSIELPRGWVIPAQQEVDTMQEKNIKNLVKEDPVLQEEAARSRITSTPPLVVIENNAGKEGFDRRGFELIASDISAEQGPLTPEAYLKAVAQFAKEKKLPVEYSGTPEKVTVNGTILWKTKLKETTNGHVQYVRQYVAIIKKCAVQYLLVGPDDAGLEELEPVIRSLHFSSSANDSERLP